jgi:hypothetical protein
MKSSKMAILVMNYEMGKSPLHSLEAEEGINLSTTVFLVQ